MCVDVSSVRIQLVDEYACRTKKRNEEKSFSIFSAKYVSKEKKKKKKNLMFFHYASLTFLFGLLFFSQELNCFSLLFKDMGKRRRKKDPLLLSLSLSRLDHH